MPAVASSSPCRPPTVDGEHLTGDVAAGAGGQEEQRPVELVGLATPTGRGVARTYSIEAGSVNITSAISVRNHPGAMALTRTPRRIHSDPS